MSSSAIDIFKDKKKNHSIYLTYESNLVIGINIQTKFESLSASYNLSNPTTLIQ